VGFGKGRSLKVAAIVKAAFKQILVDSCLLNGRKSTTQLVTELGDNTNDELGLCDPYGVGDSDSPEAEGQDLESRSQYFPENTGLSRNAQYLWILILALSSN
jgi:hypothetical protein